MSFSDSGNRRNYGYESGYQSGNSYAGNFNIVHNNIQTFSSNVTTLTKTISKIGTNSDSVQVRETM